MSSTMLRYLYHVSDQTYDPEAFQNLSIQLHNAAMLNFNVKICVRFGTRCSYGLIHLIDDIPSPISSHYMSCEEFFKNGPSFLRGNLSHYLLNPEVLDELIPNIMAQARYLFNNNTRLPSNFEDRFVVYPLAIDVVVELLINAEVVTMTESITSESMRQIRMIPASEEVIQSLNKMKFQEDIAADDIQKNQCCICLEALCESAMVSTMPCHHIFHSDCIIQWLRTSHLCPLCRYPMPVANNS